MQSSEAQHPHTGPRSEERLSSLAARPMPSLAAAINLYSTDSSISGSTEERNPLLLHRCSQDLVRGSSVAGHGGDNIHGRFRIVEEESIISSQSNTSRDEEGLERSAAEERADVGHHTGSGSSEGPVKLAQVPHTFLARHLLLKIRWRCRISSSLGSSSGCSGGSGSSRCRNMTPASATFCHTSASQPPLCLRLPLDLCPHSWPNLWLKPPSR